MFWWYIAGVIAPISMRHIKEDFPKLLDSMAVGAERITNIIISLLNFSRLYEAEI